MAPYFSYLHNETFRPRRGLMGIYYLTGVFCAVAAFCQYRKFTQTHLYYVTIQGPNRCPRIVKILFFNLFKIIDNRLSYA